MEGRGVGGGSGLCVNGKGYYDRWTLLIEGCIEQMGLLNRLSSYCRHIRDNTSESKTSWEHERNGLSKPIRYRVVMQVAKICQFPTISHQQGGILCDRLQSERRHRLFTLSSRRAKLRQIQTVCCRAALTRKQLT